MPRSLDDWRRTEATALPAWIKPQLTKLVDQPPDGPEWLHELKYDGYRMHARLDRGAVRLLTRTGLDWTSKYAAIAAAVAKLPARQAYLDGELCGVRADGTTSFSLIQNASDTGNSEALVFFLFDLLHLDGEARLIYAGRAGTGIDYAELERLWRRLEPSGNIQNAARHPAAARQPVRLTADVKPRPLGAPRTRRRSQIPDLDGRQPAAPGCL